MYQAASSEHATCHASPSAPPLVIFSHCPYRAHLIPYRIPHQCDTFPHSMTFATHLETPSVSLRARSAESVKSLSATSVLLRGEVQVRWVGSCYKVCVLPVLIPDTARNRLQSRILLAKPASKQALEDIAVSHHTGVSLGVSCTLVCVEA
jgi:hypothetical protein